MKIIILSMISFFCFASFAWGSEASNPPEPLKGEWDFNPRKVWKVNSMGDDLVAEVRHIQVDKNGQVYFFDSKLKKFYVLGPDGKYRFSFGRPGEGPGEYRRVESFFLVGNTVVIADERKVIHFSKDGKFQVDAVTGNSYKNVPRAFVDKNRFIKIPPKTDAREHERDQIDIYDITQKKSSMVAEIPGEEHVVQVAASTTVVFSGGKYKPMVILCVKDNYLYYGKNDKYKITKLNLDTKTSMTISIKDRKPNKIPQAEKDSFHSRLRKVLSKEMVDRAMKSIPEEATYYFRIDVDDNGMIYVYQTIPGAPKWTMEIDLFSPAGKYLYRSKIVFPEGSSIKSPLQIQGDYLYVSLEDQDGEVALAKYQIDKPKPDKPEPKS
jgi:hypothetical protein